MSLIFLHLFIHSFCVYGGGKVGTSTPTMPIHSYVWRPEDNL